MRCAVVGAGLAGLGSAYHLMKKGCKVTLFDEKGIGMGASGVASGLLEPYPGRRGIKSKFADEAMQLALEMVDASERALGKKVSLRNGLLRKGWELGALHPDMKLLSDTEMLVTSGVTLFMKEYLEGVFAALKGVELVVQKIGYDEPMSEFDKVVFAVGFGIKQFSLDLPIHYIKGQILTYLSPVLYERSEMAKIYLAPLGEGRVHIGSTYEHHFTHTEVDIAKALAFLRPKMPTFFPLFTDLEPISCAAGVRVTPKEGFQPLIYQMDERRYIYTGLGSRGLLYHALYGRHLADLIA